MEKKASSYSIAAIRKLLNIAFDDVGLVALCQDQFPDLCDRLARGLRKDEILNVILDYFRRRGDFVPLLAAVQVREPELYTRHEPRLLISTSPSEGWLRPSPFYETAMTHAFDLEELVNDFLDSLLGRQGLVGFAVPCSHPLVLRHLCDRLGHEWGRARVQIKQTQFLRPFHTSIDRAMHFVQRRCKPALTEKDVLLAVQIAEDHVVGRFWQHLCHAFEDEETNNRLIVILAINPGCTAPGDVVQLPQPRFRKAHVFRWVRQMVQALAWPEQVIQFWTEHMIAECSHNNELRVEWVYDHLEEILELLRQEPTNAQFQTELEKRRRIYVQTSD